MAQEFDDVLKIINVTHRKRRGINGGKFDRNSKKITHRYGKTNKIKPISSKCLRCKGKSYLHHFYCLPCHKIVMEEKKQRGII